jgi:hypothetical protein
MRISEYIGTTVGVTTAGITVACGVATAPFAVPAGIALGFLSGKAASAAARTLVSKFVGNCVVQYLTDDKPTGWNPLKLGRKVVQNAGASAVGGYIEGRLSVILNDIDRREAPINPLNSALAGGIRKVCTFQGYDIEQTVDQALLKNGGCCCPSFIRSPLARWAAQDVVSTVTEHTIKPAAEIAGLSLLTGAAWLACKVRRN